MSATEELRRLLDERGVEWNATVGASGTIWTHWDAFNGHRVHAMDNGDGTVEIFGEWDVTPEQAIAATLGSGTCQIETTENWLPAERYHRCNHCGAFFAVLDASGDIPPRCCPNCGRKVVDA